MLEEHGPLSFGGSIADGKNTPLAIANGKTAQTAGEKVVKP